MVQPTSSPLQSAANRNLGQGHLLPIDRKKGPTFSAPRSRLPAPYEMSRTEAANEINKINKPPWRPRLIASPYQLLERFVCYAKFIEKNPLQEEKLFTYKNQVVRAKLRKARPLTLTGFCTFLGITAQAWRYWRKTREDLSEAVELIENAIFAHKFEGAAAGIFKANILSRELGGIKKL